MRYVLFLGTNKCHFPQFTGDLQNSVPVRNQSRMPLIQEDPDMQLLNLRLIRSSPLLRKMHVSLSDSWQNDKLWFSICPLHPEENSYGYGDVLAGSPICLPISRLVRGCECKETAEELHKISEKGCLIVS